MHTASNLSSPPNSTKISAKSSNLLLSIFALLAVVHKTLQVQDLAIDCPAYIGNLHEESAIIAKFRSDLDSGRVKSIHHNCPEFLMKHGLFDATEYLFREWFIKHKIDIVDKVRASVHYMIKEVDRTLSLASNFKKKQKVVPVFRWAQNFTHVLIHIKFAHRFDAPACLYTWGKNLTVTDNSFYFDILGIQADTPLDYELQFPLFKEVVADATVEKAESVGTTVIHLKKKTAGIWKKLVDPKFDQSLLKIKIWWEMADVYPKAMQKYNQMIEKEDDKKGSKSAKSGDQSGSGDQTLTNSKTYTKEEKEEMKKKWLKWLSTFQ